MRQVKRKLWIILIFIFMEIGVSLILWDDWELSAGKERQMKEENFAAAYIHRLCKASAADKQKNPQTAKQQWSEEAERIHAPEYAKGFVQCILTVPSAQINRPVYAGTWEEIEYNLNLWLTVAARPDYSIGKTHYVIYGHNHAQRDVSFHNLQQSVQTGDKFALTVPSGTRVYEVADLYPLSRDAAAKLADDFSIDGDRCYIVTCGRNEFRYLDFVVEGILMKTLPPGSPADLW